MSEEKEETPSTPVKPTIYYDGNATLSIAGRIVERNWSLRVGYGHAPETLPSGARVYRGYETHCKGPECQSWVYSSMREPLTGWYTVSHLGRNETAFIHEFCSLRCLAEWLAVELAKEEDNGAAHHQ